MNPDASAWRSLRAGAVTANLIGLAAVVALAAAARASLPLGDGYPLKAAAVFGAIVCLSLGFLPRHHPFARFGAANQITTVRAMLVALVAALVGEPVSDAAAAGAVTASVAVTLLDGLDGWMARRTGVASAFGARFDMEIDALLILSLSMLAERYGKAGAWVLLSGSLRYVFVAAGTAAPWLRAPLPPSRRRQAICVVQIVGLTLVMVPGIEPPVSTAIAAAALAALVYSFLVDIVWLRRRAA